VGPQYSNDFIANFLAEMDAPHSDCDNEASCLRPFANYWRSRIVGWFHGGWSLGAGARRARILGDARNPTMQAAMNLKIKSVRASPVCSLRAARASEQLL